MRNEEQKAFTLIELLVVISVVAMLTAILMPALAAARFETQALVCKSNLRQLLIASIGYATENDGFFVSAASAGIKMAVSMVITEITTSNSISVKAFCFSSRI